MSEYIWKTFAGTEGELPPERRYVLLQVEVPQQFGTAPPSVVVGYLKYAAGDEDCPYFVIPGIGNTPTYWCDCLGDDFFAPGWPGSQTRGNTVHKTKP